jgi:hypothetical protein
MILALVGAGCGQGNAQVFEPTTPPPTNKSSGQSGTTATTGGTSRNDAPEISRSAGEAGGVVVFWPRIIPRASDDETRALATMVQQRVADLVKQTLPNTTVDVRPEPERVCPQQGCKAMTVGVLFTRDKDSCAVIALVSGSGTSPSKLVPWVGEMKIGQDTVKFREPPENQVKITDFAKCASLEDSFAAHEKDVASAIRTAAGK